MRATRPFSLRLLLALSLGAFFTLPLAGRTLLVVPFENRAGAAELDWMRESFSEGLTERLTVAGLRLISRSERLAGLERLGLPSTVALSRASLLRLGEEVGAQWVLVGHFGADNGHLRVRAQVLDLERGRLTQWLEHTGELPQLLDLQEGLAWDVLRLLEPDLFLDRQALRQRLPPLQLSAFESYVRGLGALDREQQRAYFLQAVRVQPAYSAPAFQLARLHYDEEDYAAATAWFEKVALEDPRGPEARFYLSLCHFRLDRFGEAVDVLRLLADRMPSPALWSNLGVFASRLGDNAAAGDYFQRVLRALPGDVDAHFNFALHHLRRREWQEALPLLQQALSLQPGDGEARALLVYALRRLGRDREARDAQRQGEAEAWADVEVEDRLNELDRLQFYFAEPPPGATSSRARHLSLHLERGRDLLARGQLDLARLELTEAILLDPASARAHFFLGRVYQQQSRLPEAIAELRASLWSQDSLDARLALAEIYGAQHNLAEARRHLQAALALDPGNARARALGESLGQVASETSTGSVE